ncbi:MAG: hypothetical protein HRU20_13660 [Pseudomonadales bacterium]|nr:hypothetical protein [Pseudomonadales bacterium]
MILTKEIEITHKDLLTIRSHDNRHLLIDLDDLFYADNEKKKMQKTSSLFYIEWETENNLFYDFLYQ